MSKSVLQNNIFMYKKACLDNTLDALLAILRAHVFRASEIVSTGLDLQGLQTLNSSKFLNCQTPQLSNC